MKINSLNTELFEAARRAENRVNMRAKYQYESFDGEGLSIIVLVYNSLKITLQCLDALRKDVPKSEIILVNNGSGAETTEALRRLTNIKLIEWPENKGVAIGRNAGARLASGSLLCFIDNDTIVNPGGVQCLASQSRHHGIAGIVGGALRPVSLEFLRRVEDSLQSDYVEACCVIFKREVWECVGELDEIFSPVFCEDSDWCLRARKAGFQWAIVPEAAHHYSNHATGILPNMGKMAARQTKKLAKKHQGLGAGERIGIELIGGFGDCIMLTSALETLKRKRPLARVHLITHPVLVNFFQGLSTADLISEKKEWDYTEFHDLCDVVSQRDASLNFMHPVFYYNKILGIPMEFSRYAVPQFQEKIQEAAGRLPGKNYIACGINSSNRPLASWNGAKWKQLFQSMPDKKFVLFSLDYQPNINVNLNSHFDASLYALENVIDLTGKIGDLRLVAALMNRCEGCVSVDTGLFHLAASLNIPTVVMIAGALGWGRMPFFAPVRLLQGQSPCYPCIHRKDSVSWCVRPESHCLQWLTPETVKTNLLEILPSE